ncbi:MAG: LacI family DNA-binding transcriptional regulator [Treponema sp.]|nr:LacI family DNA-binding transcriptional regulator [Treponema sp.]
MEQENEGRRKVRLADIAEQLGVSIVTVSKAIAGKDGVSEELRVRIKALADQMGYIQKSRSPLPGRKDDSTGNIGVVIPSHFFERSTSFYWTMYNALSRELISRGYYAIMEQLGSKDEFGLVLPQIVQNHKVDGVILLGQTCEDYARFFSRQYKDSIFLDFYVDDRDSDSVTTDNFYSEYQMTRYLISQGHKNIRYVGNFNATTSITDRFMGFMKAMLENGYRVSVDDIINDRNQKGFYEQIRLPEKPEEMPTAFVCNCDETARRLIGLLKERGISVPDDVSVVGFDNFLSDGQQTTPALTTVEVDPVAMARTAVDILLKKIAGEPYTHGHTVIGGRLLLRDSVRKINEGDGR